ncbi:MAG: DUF2267 domain-containing protein [Verrucomicrobia bacterium]|nr:DUF2267 domain-containing protein [Verrucomicrobiota bacterium]
MKKSEVPIIANSAQKTHIWLKEIARRMGWNDQQLAYQALRAVLQALRDRLPVEVVAKLGAQLPLLIRGIYYENWVPSHTPFRLHHVEDFLGLVSVYLGNDRLIPDTESITKNVFLTLQSHLTAGEIKNVKRVLPDSIAAFWPQGEAV